MTFKDSVAQKVVNAGGRLRVRSALNPVLWLCAIITIPGIAYIGVFDSVPIFIQVLIGAPVFAAVFGFLFLLFFDRDKLQSEDFQIRKQTLELVQEKGDKFPILADTLEAITNPRPRQIESKSEEGEQ